MAIIGSTVLIYHFLDKAVNIVPTGIKWMEAALVSMIGLTMSASNRDKKWVISSEKGTKDSRYHVPERSVSHATMWLVCFFVIESLAGLCLVDIIISPVVESTIGVLLFPIATLSFIHTFVK
jgi:hypothetical protein